MEDKKKNETPENKKEEARKAAIKTAINKFIGSNPMSEENKKALYKEMNKMSKNRRPRTNSLW